MLLRDRAEIDAGAVDAEPPGEKRCDETDSDDAPTVKDGYLEHFRAECQPENALALCFVEQIHACARSALRRSALVVDRKRTLIVRHFGLLFIGQASQRSRPLVLKLLGQRLGG